MNVVFDLDGTLLDSRPGIVTGLRLAMKRLGRALPEDEPLDWAIGPPLARVMARLLAPFNDDRVEVAVRAYREWYGRVGLFDARVYPGVPELLEGLGRGGWTLFVCTAKRTNFACRVLEHFGLLGRFRAVYGSEEHGRFDDKTDLLRHLLATEGLEGRPAVLIGDSEHDVHAGRACGVRVLGAGWGYGGREELIAAGADDLLDSPAQLPERLREWEATE
jgi:phosphoglycolate phosphatase